MRALIVREPFGDYAKGQAIRDPEAIAAVEAACQAHFCTPTDVPDDFFGTPEPVPVVKPVIVAPIAAPLPAAVLTPPAAPPANNV